MSKLSMVEKNKKAKRKIDWVGIKNHYRAGLLSIREIASLHGISHTTIQRHVKAEGWTRDLKAKVHAKADALVLKQDNSEAVATSNSVESQTPQSEKVIVESNAKVIADVRLEHRAFMTRFRKIYEKLVAELEFQTESPELFERLGEWLSDKEDVGSKGLNNQKTGLL